MLRFAINDELTDGIERALAAGSDFSPAMQFIADALEESTRYRFEIGEGPDGEAWEPSQRAIEDGGQTLVDTARLLGSIASAHDARSALVGTNLIYAAPNNFGAIIPGRASKAKFGPPKPHRLPQREFVGFSAEDIAMVERELTAHLIAGGFTQ